MVFSPNIFDNSHKFIKKKKKKTFDNHIFLTILLVDVIHTVEENYVIKLYISRDSKN